MRTRSAVVKRFILNSIHDRFSIVKAFRLSHLFADGYNLVRTEGVSGSYSVRRMEPVISQLAPFNEHRFKACMSYLLGREGRSLTQYDLVKLHVLIDVFHVMSHGQPVIGGQLSAWKHGPVFKRAFNLIKSWSYRKRETGEDPEGFVVTSGEINKINYATTNTPDPDDFSDIEIESMLKAWNILMKMDWNARDRYFHTDESFIGKVWKSTPENSPISWDCVIDEYALENCWPTERVERLKRAIRN